MIFCILLICFLKFRVQVCHSEFSVSLLIIRKYVFPRIEDRVSWSRLPSFHVVFFNECFIYSQKMNITVMILSKCLVLILEAQATFYYTYRKQSFTCDIMLSLLEMHLRYE